MDMHEYVRSRGVSQADLDLAEVATQEKIDAYQLAEARRARKMTQAELAQRMGVSQARVSELESGELGATRLDTLRRYVASLGGQLVVSAEWPDASLRLA